MAATKNIPSETVRNTHVERLEGETHSGDVGGGAAGVVALQMGPERSASVEDGQAADGLAAGLSGTGAAAEWASASVATHGRVTEPSAQDQQNDFQGETLAAVNELLNDESQLRRQADDLDGKASELEHSGDDEAMRLAGHMRGQAGTMLKDAAEIDRAVQDLQHDPGKKLPRRKLERLHHASVTAAVIVGQEVEAAQVNHAVGEEQQQVIVHAQMEAKEAHEHAHSPKKAPEKAVSVKKPVVKMHPSGVHGAGVHGVVHAPEEGHVGARLHHYASVAKHTVVHAAHEAWHAVHRVCSGVAHAGEMVMGFGRRVAHGMLHAGPVVFLMKVNAHVLHGLMHPLETAGHVMEHAAGMMASAKALVGHWFGFGVQAQEAPVVASASVEASPGMSAAVMERVRQVSLPGVMGARTVDGLGALASPLLGFMKPGVGMGTGFGFGVAQPVY